MAIGTGAALIIGSIIGALGGLAGQKSASDAAEKAAKTQANATKSATELQYDFLRQNRAEIADAVDKGLIDINTGFNAAMDEYMKAMNDPDLVMNRPGVKFQYEQGLDALKSGFSRTSGGGLSGPMIKAAQEYGQGFASNALDAELNRLSPYLNLLTGKANATANLRVGGATGTAGITGTAANNISNLTLQGGENAAAAAIRQGNINTNYISGATNQIQDLLTLAALRPELFRSE